jgi:hypothetical protein
MDTARIAQAAPIDTREKRALDLYRTRGHELRHVGEDMYLVPSCSGRSFYSVDYREETCDCPDHRNRGVNCKHILAVGIHHAKHRLRPSVCACLRGFVFVGHLIEDPDTGEEVEVVEARPCRRCADNAGVDR